jgi:hypothetical protein
MQLFAVEHEAAPFPALIEAFDVYGAARKYRAALEQAGGGEIVEGEQVKVAPLGVDAPGEVMTLEWCEGINNFTKVEGE